jgi:DNA-binding transcriptional ArsR family regulator
MRDLVGLDMSTVSKHLAVLKAAGVLADESVSGLRSRLRYCGNGGGGITTARWVSSQPATAPPRDCP